MTVMATEMEMETATVMEMEMEKAMGLESHPQFVSPKYRGRGFQFSAPAH